MAVERNSPDHRLSFKERASVRIHSSLRFGAIACLAVMGLAATEHHGAVVFGGLPLPGATVTASQGEKKVTAVTDPQGLYSFADLADGVWSMQVEMLCFTPSKREIAVAPGAPPAEWEMKMLPFDEIKAAAPPPPPSAAPPPPAAGAPSATPQPAQPASAAKPAGKGKAKAKGAAAANSQSGYQRADVNASDGAPAPGPESDSGAGGMGADASQGASEAMVVNGSTSNGIERRAFGNGRRGPGSMFNGNLSLTESNSALNARNYSLTGQNTAQPANNNATLAGSFGGPLWIPHVLRRNGMFFIGYQGTRSRIANTTTTLMPTAQERNGDFSQAMNPMGQPVAIFDPNGGAPFPGNAIPQSRIGGAGPQAAALLSFYPQPNFLADSRYNFQIPWVAHTGTDGVQARVYRSLGSKNNVNAGFGYQNTRQSNPNPSGFGFVDTTNSAGLNSNVSWRRNFEKTVFGTFTYSYSRYSSRGTPYFSGRENVSGEAGISGNDQSPGDWGPPSLSFSSGMAGLSDGTLSLMRNQTQSLGGNVQWTRRPHNMTFGGDFRRLQLNNLSQQNPRGAIGFNGTATEEFSAGAPVFGTGSDFADFLLGIPDTASIAFGNADKYFRQGTYDLYANDDFRATSTLTINGGVRWEYSSPMTEKFGRLVNLDVVPGFKGAAPVVANAPTGPLTGIQYPDSLLHPDKHAVQPRIGLAWHPFLASSMLIRAGYGVTYDTSGYTSISSSMAQQAPLSKSLSVANTPANPLTLANPFVAPPGALTNTFGIDPNFRIGYSQSWQASVQQDIPGSMVMTVTYLGIKGTRAVQQFLPNTYPAGVPNPCATCLPGYYYMTSNGNSTRNSGSLQLRRRFHNGFLASANYTYSKAIDDAALGGRGQGSAVTAQNWLDLAGERGLSPFDQRHLLNAQLQYSTGVGIRGGGLLSGWRGAIVKGWTASTNISAGSGLPETPMYSQTVAGTGVVGPIRPLYTGAGIYDAPPGRFLNPAAYTAPLVGFWGNAGRDTIIGPNRFSMNASMERSFSKLTLRVAANNALNHASYNSWVTNISSSQFGLANPPGSMRNLTLNLRWRF
jgi:hypothetical protein